MSSQDYEIECYSAVLKSNLFYLDIHFSSSLSVSEKMSQMFNMFILS